MTKHTLQHFTYMYLIKHIKHRIIKVHEAIIIAGVPNIEGWLGNFVIFHGILTRIAKKPYILVVFQEGDTDPCPPPPLDPRIASS